MPFTPISVILTAMAGHNKGIFLARDGILLPRKPGRENVTAGEVIEGAPQAISRMRELGFTIFVVTNHEAVAHGDLKETRLEDLHCELVCAISDVDSMAFVDGIYYCAHHHEAKLEDYKEDCECRIPKPGLLEKAAGDFSVDLARSFMVGDHESAVVAGHLAGARSVLIRGPGNELEPIESSLTYEAKVAVPEATLDSLAALVDWLATDP